jgi:hypothetical protein
VVAVKVHLDSLKNGVVLPIVGSSVNRLYFIQHKRPKKRPAKVYDEVNSSISW